MGDQDGVIGGVRRAGQPYISVSDVQMNYETTVAVKSLSFDIAKNEFVAIVGPSGCGKSTLLHAMSGLMRPESGSITISGCDVTGDSFEIPPIGYVYQEPRLLPWRTVRRNIELALDAASAPRDVWGDRISRFLSMLRIDSYADSWPLKLSGGQQQRVAIARALAIHPSVVLMDEPFSTLDEVTARALRQQLLSVWEQEQRTVVFVTHSLREALFLADRVFVLTKGPAELLKECVVDLPRPRDYDDSCLTRMEAALVSEVMGPWGYY
jgi:ABC-type nitrate/sulfonate/bicarbonate transport system ATPase subunit